MENIYFQMKWCEHPYHWSRHGYTPLLKVKPIDSMLVYSLFLSSKDRDFPSLEKAVLNVAESKRLDPKYHVPAALIVIEDAIAFGIWN